MNNRLLSCKIMKYPLLLGGALLLLAMLSGCDNREDGSFAEPLTIAEKIKGNYQLQTVTEIDETAKTAGMDVTEIALTDEFNFVTFGITLNADDKNQPTAYSVAGDAPELFAKEGYWDLNFDFPKTDGSMPVILLYADAAKTQKTGELVVSAMPGATGNMELRLTRKVKATPFVSYSFKLTKKQ